mmetsp:Transcript_23114/g.53618  ORF Transcript_23114/g.53618 Transcript_23114/m.53618 type:complete len:91 (+) Transcript_23114:345-617(+)
MHASHKLVVSSYWSRTKACLIGIATIQTYGGLIIIDHFGDIRVCASWRSGSSFAANPQRMHNENNVSFQLEWSKPLTCTSRTIRTRSSGP